MHSAADAASKYDLRMLAKRTLTPFEPVRVLWWMVLSSGKTRTCKPASQRWTMFRQTRPGREITDTTSANPIQPLPLGGTYFTEPRVELMRTQTGPIPTCQAPIDWRRDSVILCVHFNRK